MVRVNKWGWGLGIATATALTAFGAASWHANAAPNPGNPTAASEETLVSDPKPGPERKNGIGVDALTTDEVTRARTIALTPELAAQAKDVTGKAGPQYLSVELAADGSRTADVYFYDYGKNKLFKQVVDLQAGKLAKSFSADSMQLPATQPEVDAALDLLLADPAAADLKDAYKKATGKEFAGKDGLTVNAHVFKARAADPTVKQCGKHRCLQLVVETPDGLFIDVHQIIVDLSGRKIARLS